MDYPVPDGLKDLLHSFTLEVLKQQPEDLVDFAVQYFNDLQENRAGTFPRDSGRDATCRLGIGRAVNFAGVDMMQSDIENGDGGEEFVVPIFNRFSRRSSVCAEAINPDEEEDEQEPRVTYPKTDDQRKRLQEACKNILLFKNLDLEQMAQVLDAMFERNVDAGEHIIELDDDGDNFYVIERGTFDIVKKVDNSPQVVGTYNNSGSFGELALMYNTPRAATIIATSSGSLWALERQTFRRIIVKNNAKKRRVYEAFIESLPLLESLEPSERMRVVDVLSSKTYTDGERIITQGDKADCFYIVESGHVRITIIRQSKTRLDKASEEVEIAVCSRGEYFGELALVTNKPRAASAYAKGNVKCLVMDIHAFERLLGPCVEIMKRNIIHYEEQLASLFRRATDIESETT